MRQADRVLMYLKMYGSITPLDAFRDLGITCLAERVRDLRNEGHEIISTPEKSKNRFGDVVRYVRYSLCQS